MNFPENLKYAKSHEWVEFLDDGSARIGLSDHAQSTMGSIVFMNLPEEGDSFAAGESIGDVESVKAVSEVFTPVAGKVSAVNEALLDSPEKINEDPYGAWLVELEELGDQVELMDAEAYEAFCQEEE